ncbi:MAG TPA: MATE family efflux transporter [Oscillospiraceae bacterium]|nr:MATE family efflux transporter [Oscillospiraceae bacterium]
MKTVLKDMTAGNPAKLLLTFTLPMLVGNMIQQFYTIVDSAIVGNYVGANALAAVGATGSIQFLFFSLCNGMATGIGIVIAQFVGSKNEEYVKRSIVNAAYVMISCAAVMSILGVSLARPVLQLLNTPSNILDDSVVFMRTTCVGILAISGYNCISAILRSLGDSKTPLVFLLLSITVNISLDFLFVLGFGMGVFGAALATVIAQTVSVLGCLIFAFLKNPYFRIPKQYLLPDKFIIGKCIRLGFPVALQSSMIAFSCVALQGVVNSFGSVVVAAFTATNRIEQLVQQPYASLGTAVSTYTGQNIGAGNIERVKKGYHKSFLIIGIFTLCMLPIAQFCGHFMIRLFVNDAQVIALGTQALRITSWFYFPLGMIYISRSLLNGAGDTIYSFMNGILEMAGRIGLAAPLTKIGAIGVWGVWLATGLTWLITGVASWMRYLNGKWKHKSVVRNG